MKAAFLAVLLAVIAVGLWASGIFAPPARHLLISDAHVHPAMGGGGVAVLSIDNQGAPDELIAVSSPMAEVAFHGAEAGLPIQTGPSSLAVDGAHIRLSPPSDAFEEGLLVPLTLIFAEAGDVSVKARFSTPEPGSAAAHAAMGHGAMLQSDPDLPSPTVTVGATQSGDGWTAQIDTTNFTFSEDQQDGPHAPGVGHGHIYLGGMKLGRVFSESFAIGELPTGTHQLRVTLNTNDHRAYGTDGQPISATTVIVVD